ncbi:protein kinase, partial [Acidobacteriota bacterium]
EPLVTKTIQAEQAISLGNLIAQKYRIIKELGRGGMGSVFKAEDTRLHRPVALKFLAPELTRDKEARERFIQEARAASALDHPNICTVHEIDAMSEEHVFIAMACYEGQTLKERESKGALKLEEALDVAIQTAKGLAKAHEKGIIHRDIKPANIMITPDGIVKILDFGLAKLSGQIWQTRPGILLGTPAYMSPEQAKGEVVDQRTDIWSLGVVLYQALTGQMPFRGENEHAIIHAIIHTKPEPLGQFLRQAPERIKGVIEKALAKNPNSRYQNMAEMLNDLISIKKYLASPGLKKRPTKPLTWKRKLFPVAGILVLFIILIMAWRLLFIEKPSDIDSIAVLPLQNLSKDPEQEYFSDGMTEALITELSKISALRVISRQSVMRYKGSNKPLPEIARELSVDTVVEGSILQVGKKVRITAQLIDAQKDQHLWAQSYERNMQDILALQSEVARAITREIRVAVTPEENARFAKTPRVNPEAHQALLKARFHFFKFTGASIRKAIEYLQEAIAKDPNYALPNALLAACYLNLTYFTLSDPREYFTKAKAAAKRAISLDDELGEAHVTLGWVLALFEYDWPRAEKELTLGLQLNPSFAPGYQIYTNFLVSQGRYDEAITAAQRAVELDPVSPVIGQHLGFILYLGRRYDEAMEQLEKTIALEPNFWFSYERLARVYEAKGMYAEALAEAQKAVELSGGEDPIRKGAVGHLLALLGKRKEARTKLAKMLEWSKTAYVPPTAIANVYLGLSEEEKAIDWLEKAYEVRDGDNFLLNDLPSYDPIRSNPRFQNLIRRIGFPKPRNPN